MIPTLLWRCPICSTNDALEHNHRFLKPDLVVCRHCGTNWEVRRVVGKDYKLKVTASPAYPDEVGKDVPLAEWYARMKATKILIPIQDTALELSDGEELYLASRRVSLTAMSNDTTFFSADDGSDGETEPLAKFVSDGRLFLTNQKLVWQGEDGKQLDYPLTQINSLYTLFNIAAVLMVSARLHTLRFREESMLKWVNYFGVLAAEIKTATGHKITTSNY